MIKFLTSNFKMYTRINGVKIPKEIDNTNHIVDQIKDSLKSNDTILFIASSPNDTNKIESYSSILFESLKLSGIEFKNYYILDGKNMEKAKELISVSDLVFLSGGSTYEQNCFFNQIKLSNLLFNYNGLLIGQSAGSLNMSQNVFNSPEEMEESEPIHFDGLNLTTINIEPHFKLEYDINNPAEIYQRNCILEESKKRVLYGQCDGSHIVIDETGNSIIYGETYLIKDGIIKKICSNKESYLIEDKLIKK